MNIKFKLSTKKLDLLEKTKISMIEPNIFWLYVMLSKKSITIWNNANMVATTILFWSICTRITCKVYTCMVTNFIYVNVVWTSSKFLSRWFSVQCIKLSILELNFLVFILWWYSMNLHQVVQIFKSRHFLVDFLKPDSASFTFSYIIIFRTYIQNWENLKDAESGFKKVYLFSNFIYGKKFFSKSAL